MHRSIWRVKHFKRARVARSGQMNVWALGGVCFVYMYVLICDPQTEEKHNSDSKRLKITDFYTLVVWLFELGLLTDNPTSPIFFFHCTLLQLLNCAVKCMSLACPFLYIRSRCCVQLYRFGSACRYLSVILWEGCTNVTGWWSMSTVKSW